MRSNGLSGRLPGRCPNWVATSNPHKALVNIVHKYAWIHLLARPGWYFPLRSQRLFVSRVLKPLMGRGMSRHMDCHLHLDLDMLCVLSLMLLIVLRLLLLLMLL